MKSKTPNKRFGLPLGTLLLSNIAIIVWAMLANWKVLELIWVYWFQTLALGIFSSLRLLRFPVFLTEETTGNIYFFKKPEISVKTLSKIPSVRDRNFRFWHMLLLFCLGHYLYYSFFIGKMNESPPNTAILLAGIVFFINQLFTFLHQKEKDCLSKVFVDKYTA